MAKALKPASASPNKIQLRSLFMFSSSFCAIPLPRPDTLGAEKKSGVPYILTSQGRHRQTPASKHDQKTRHVGLAHVAQLRISLTLTLAKFSLKRQYAVAYVAGGLSGLPSSSEGSGGPRGDRPTGGPRFCLTSLGDTARSASGPYQLVATSATSPVVSGRWQVLGAASRRAIASRKAVPADVKDQTSRPLKGKVEILCHNPPSVSSGKCGFGDCCWFGAG